MWAWTAAAIAAAVLGATSSARAWEGQVAQKSEKPTDALLQAWTCGGCASAGISTDLSHAKSCILSSLAVGNGFNYALTHFWFRPRGSNGGGAKRSGAGRRVAGRGDGQGNTD